MNEFTKTTKFEIRGVEVEVEYNSNLCTEKEVQRKFTNAKTLKRFQELDEEFAECKNYLDVVNKLFPEEAKKEGLPKSAEEAKDWLEEFYKSSNVHFIG